MKFRPVRTRIQIVRRMDAAFSATLIKDCHVIFSQYSVCFILCDIEIVMWNMDRSAESPFLEKTLGDRDRVDPLQRDALFVLHDFVGVDDAEGED